MGGFSSSMFDDQMVQENILGLDLKSRKKKRRRHTPRIYAQTKSSMVASGYVKIAIENGHW